MSHYEQVVNRWLDTVYTPRDPQHHSRPAKGNEFPRHLNNERMPYDQDGRAIYSYGSHFPMAEVIRDDKGEVALILQNGDVWGPTTTGHQGYVRSAIARTSFPTVTIPFSVLDAAGITRSTVQLREATADRIVETTRDYTEVQPGWVWTTTDEGYHREPNDAEKAQRVARWNAKRHQEWLEQLTEDLREIPIYTSPRHPVRWTDWQRLRFSYRHGVGMFPPADHTWDQAVEATDTARTSRYWSENRMLTQRVFVKTHEQQHLWTSRHHNNEIQISETPEGPVYSITTRRHWLGESVIRASVPQQVRRKCKDCGGTGARPYDASSHTFAEEIDSTSSMWFACQSCRVDGYRRTWTHNSNGADYTRGRGTVRTTRNRWAVYLSGFDRNENRPTYFFNEMPTQKSTTVEEAYDELMPDTVKMAVQMGREVARQGDIFALPLPSMTRRELTKLGATFGKRGQLLGTNHVGSEVAYLPDGRTLMRGTMTHAPEFRRPDHARVSLPKGVWHLVVKNTVPVQSAA